PGTRSVVAPKSRVFSAVSHLNRVAPGGRSRVTGPWRRGHNLMTWRARASAASAAVALIATLAAAPANAAPNNNTVRKLTQAVTPDGVLNHLEGLQAVADANGGDRAAGRPGYA